MLCERCRAQPIDVVYESMCLCAPCAETLAWSHGVYPHGPVATGALSDVSPLGVVVPPVGVLQFFGKKAPEQHASDPSAKLPLGRIALVLGGVAVMGLGLLWISKVHEGAIETRRGIMRAIEKHPEMLA